MNKFKIALVAAVLAAAGTVSAQDLTSVNAKYAEAAEAMKTKNFANAATLFEQVINEGMDIDGAEAMVTGAKQYLPTAIFQSGLPMAQGGKLDEALATFTRAAELSELYGNVATLNNSRTMIGRVVMMQGAEAFNSKDYATAAAIFQKGYDANPNDTALGLNLALSYSGLKDFAKSGEIYKNIIALGEKDSRFAENAAKARENWSLDALEKASESAKAGDYQAAIDAADELLAVMPGDAALQLTRLQAYNSMKNYSRVIELGETAAAAQTGDEARSDVWYLVGAAYQNQQNLPQAIAAYGKVTTGGNVAAAKAQVAELQKVGK
jgi:tetratricopeptide (TPR) repeat protein